MRLCVWKTITHKTHSCVLTDTHAHTYRLTQTQKDQGRSSNKWLGVTFIRVTISLWTSCPLQPAEFQCEKPLTASLFSSSMQRGSASGSKWLDTAGIFWSEFGGRLINTAEGDLSHCVSHSGFHTVCMHAYVSVRVCVCVRVCVYVISHVVVVFCTLIGDLLTTIVILWFCPVTEIGTFWLFMATICVCVSQLVGFLPFLHC